MRSNFLLGLLAVLVGGCGAIGFDIERPIEEQIQRGDPIAHTAARVVPGQSPINPLVLSIDLAGESAARGVGPIERVFLRELSFGITATAQPPGDSDCWDFVESIEVRVESTQDGSSLPTRTIASAMRPGCVQQLVLTPAPDVNLKPYIEQGLRISATVSGIPPADDVSFDGRVVLRAEAF
jgi:hypothetical protein